MDRKQYLAEYRAKHKDHISKVQHEWYMKNKEAISARRKEKRMSEVIRRAKSKDATLRT